MRTGKSLLGLAIVGQQDGTQIGSVHDLIFDHETDQVLALLVNQRDLFGLMDAQIVAWSEIQSIGNDVVLVKNANSKTPLKAHENIHRVAQNARETVLSGTKILTTEGKELGTLADTRIDETSGKVLGFEVSGGFIADSLRGKKFLPSPPGLEVGADAAIAPPEAAAAMKIHN